MRRVIPALTGGPIAPNATEAARFSVFARAWATAVLLGLVSQDMATSPLRMLLCALALVVLVVPGPLVLLLLAAAYPVHWAVDTYPQDFIHTWLVAVFSSALGIGLLTSVRRDATEWSLAFVAGFAPQAVVLAGFALFATGLAKLNHDFWNPATSCAAVFYDYQRTIPPFLWVLPDAPWADRAAIVLTQVAETLGGLLILAPARARKPGVLLAFGFLLIVGTNPVGRLYEFTAPFLALLTLGISWPPLSDRAPRWLAAVATIALTAAVVLAMQVDAPSPWIHARHTAGSVVFGVAALVGLLAISTLGETRPVGSGLSGPGRLAWVPVLALILHETLPYQGLRTQHNLTMAANFLVNTKVSNHWLVREVPTLPWNHLAVLTASSDPTLDKRGRIAWVDWRLFDYLAHHPEISVTFTIDGTTTTLGRAGDEPRAHHSWVAHLLPVLPTPVRAGAVDCASKRPKP